MEKNEALQQMIEDFNKSKTVKDLDRYFREKSMMEILGIDRDENAHSNFLAWLFGNPVTDKEACNLLFELLKKKKAEIIEIEDTINQENRKNLEEQDEFLTDLLHQNPITIKVTREDFVCAYYSRDREKPAIHKGEKGDKIIKGRTDIVLTINDVYKIIIENKVCSEEICKWHCLKEEPSEIPVKDELTQNPKQSLWQSQFYFDFYSTSSNSKNVYVFLTLPREKPPVCGSFIHITYQDIMDNLLIPILGKVIDDKTLAIINGYVKALSINYTQDEIMAVNPELVMLYKSLLNENKTLFNKFENRSENTEALIEFWNSYNVLGSMNGYILRPILKAKEMCEHINEVKEKKKDNTKYLVGEDKDEKGKAGLFGWIIEQYIKKKGDGLEMLQQTFPPSLHGKTASSRNKNISDNHIVIGYPKNRFTQIGNYPIYVCHTGWDGPAMMSRIIKYAKEDIAELKDLKILEIPDFLQNNNNITNNNRNK